MLLVYWWVVFTQLQDFPYTSLFLYFLGFGGGYFIYLYFKYFKCYPPFSVFPPQTHYHLPCHSSTRVLPHLHTQSCLSILAFPYPGALSLHRSKGLPSHWCPKRQSFATHAAGVIGTPYVLFGLWFSPWLVDIVVFPMRLQTHSQYYP